MHLTNKLFSLFEGCWSELLPVAALPNPDYLPSSKRSSVSNQKTVSSWNISTAIEWLATKLFSSVQGLWRIGRDFGDLLTSCFSLWHILVFWMDFRWIAIQFGVEVLLEVIIIILIIITLIISSFQKFHQKIWQSSVALICTYQSDRNSCVKFKHWLLAYLHTANPLSPLLLVLISILHCSFKDWRKKATHLMEWKWEPARDAIQK